MLDAKKDGDTAGGFAEQSAEQSKAAAEQSRPAAAQEKPVKQMGLAEQKGFYPIEETIEDDDLPF